MPRASLFQGGKQINIDDILANPTPPQSPMSVAPISPQTEKTIEDDPQKNDPSLSWFSSVPLDRETEQYYQEDINQFETDFAKNMSRWKPQTLAAYMELGDKIIQQIPELEQHVRRRMLDSMPNDIKGEYKAKLQESQARRQIDKDIQMEIYRKEAFSLAGFPDEADAKAEADSRKADAAERKVRSEMRKDLGVIDNSIDNMEFDISKVMQDGKTAEAERMQSQLSRMQRDKQDIYRDLGWTDDTPPEAVVQDQVGPQQVVDQAQYDALPSGTRYIDPNGTIGTKR